MAILHVTFGQSAAFSLRKALTTLGRDERVCPMVDDLTVGPITSPMTAASRVDWCRSSAVDDDEVIAELDAFWAEVASPDVSLIVWMSHRSVRDLTGLLALVALRGPDLRVIDVADVPFVGRDGQPRPDTGQTFGYVRDDQIVAHRLLDLAAPLSPDAIATHHATWARLRREDAELRILDETGLRSVPMTYFDDTIRSYVTADWQRCARVVGNAWNAASSGLYAQVSDYFIWCRLLELIEDGELESDGDLSSMHDSRVRRRSGERAG